jgi:hypothetical protein
VPNHNIFRAHCFLLRLTAHDFAATAPFGGDGLPVKDYGDAVLRRSDRESRQFIRVTSGQTPAAGSTWRLRPSWERKQSAHLGPSMVAALVNSTLNLRPGATPAGFTRFRAVNPVTAPRCNPDVSGALVDCCASAQINIRRGFSH